MGLWTDHFNGTRTMGDIGLGRTMLPYDMTRTTTPNLLLLKRSCGKLSFTYKQRDIVQTLDTHFRPVVKQRDIVQTLDTHFRPVVKQHDIVQTRDTHFHPVVRASYVQWNLCNPTPEICDIRQKIMVPE